MPKERRENKSSERTGSAANPTDPELAIWLHRLWARNEPPSRIELRQMFGQNKRDLGGLIFHEDYKATVTKDQEQAVVLANEIMAAAQHDCNSVKREQHYQLIVTDPHRSAHPLVRRLGPLRPNQAMLSVEGDGSSHEENEDGEALSGKSLALAYIKEANDQVRWDKGRYDKVMGGMLGLQDSIIRRQEEVIDRLTNNQMDFFMRLQEAEDRRLERDIRRKKEELMGEIWRDVFRMGRNLIPGLLSGSGPSPQLQESAPSGPENTASGTPGPQPQRFYGNSPERALVDNFLSDCESTNIDIKLFGDWKDGEEGKLEQIKEGIFKPAQFAVLIGVRVGKLPPAALDDLLPEANTPLSVTGAQLTAAMAIMSEGTMMALHELISIRRKAREAAAAANATKTAKEGVTP